MSITATNSVETVFGDKRVKMGTLAWDSSYPTGGEAITAATFGLKTIDFLLALPSAGYVFEWDSTNSKIKAFRTEAGGADLTANTGGVVDSDTAASTGVAVYVVPESNGIYAHLESTTAGNADFTYTVGSGGPSVLVTDSDTPGGVVTYFDEDAASADSRFLCVSPTGADLLVPCSDGSFIRFVHDASAASNGVAVYGDDDAANSYERLLFVSPTDTAGTFTTDDTVSGQYVAGADAALAEVGSTVSLAAVTASPYVVFGA